MPNITKLLISDDALLYPTELSFTGSLGAFSNLLTLFDPHNSDWTVYYPVYSMLVVGLYVSLFFSLQSRMSSSTGCPKKMSHSDF